ncbi:MAG TPA: anaerobic ribonucleoside-triphosphate reductase activating protein [Candidatus Limnocylindria bacterium]|nr:anaerobic ribonucleoside-triphosphate reductase activating protein [Candidatus Limnocylindria bacterium]
MDIRIFGLAQDSIVDGPGLRFSVFTQGCPHRCAGCHNPGSHDPAGGTVYDTADIVRMAAGNPLLDGVTLTGGEPFFQAAACLDIARGAKGLGLNVWIYSGSTYEELLQSPDPAARELLKVCDVLVDGPFVQAERSLDLDFRGSRNQRLIDLRRSGPGGAVPWSRQEAMEAVR